MKNEREVKNKKIAKTKIIATIGPSSANKETLRKLYENGMSCARINTAHGDFEQYKSILNLIKQSGSVPVMIDIKGPEIRIRLTENLNILANTMHEFGFQVGKLPYFSYDFSNQLKEGDLIFFDNGQIESKVVSVKNGIVKLLFEESCIIKTNKGVNVPGKELNIPALSEKDKEAIIFSVENKISFIGLSFARYKEDILEVRKLLGNSGISIISKIENHEGLKNIDEIIEHSDGIMIARGDLGVEIPAEQIPYIQKEIIKKCNNAGKISIVATQMLESMTSSKIPTRAEVSDVANAVLDGADVVMLSGETASGKFPVEAVTTMRNIALQVEDKIEHNVVEKQNMDVSKKISSVAYHLAESSDVDKIICVTRSGFSARLVSRYRPSAQVIGVTDSQNGYEQLHLVWGVLPVMMDALPARLMMPRISEELMNRDLLQLSDNAVFIGGIRTLEKNVSNLVEIHNIQNLLEYKDHLIETQ